MQSSTQKQRTFATSLSIQRHIIDGTIVHYNRTFRSGLLYKAPLEAQDLRHNISHTMTDIINGKTLHYNRHIKAAFHSELHQKQRIFVINDSLAFRL